jgi:hypothetical protein
LIATAKTARKGEISTTAAAVTGAAGGILFFDGWCDPAFDFCVK